MKYMQAQYLYIDKNKGQPHGLKKTNQQHSLKEGKKKWKRKCKKTISTMDKCKDTNNYYEDYNIDGHTKDESWNLHPKLNPRSYV